jgi:hypothetical protein
MSSTSQPLESEAVKHLHVGLQVTSECVDKELTKKVLQNPWNLNATIVHVMAAARPEASDLKG